MTGSIILILNIALYLFTTLWLVKKQRTFTIGAFLLVSYTVVAFFCYLNYKSNPKDWHLNLFPFIYLFVVVIILFSPFINRRIKIKENPIGQKNQRLYKLVAKGYIVLSLYSCTVYLPQVIEIIINPSWLDLYTEAHEEADTNIFIKFANLFFHIRYLGLVLFLSYLTRKKNRPLFLLLLGMSAILPIVLVTIKQASRGGFVSLFVSLIVVYLMFRDQLSERLKRWLKMITLTVLPASFIYISAVTVARFENNPYVESVGGTVLDYLGHSMLTFAYGIFDSISKFSWGGFMFNFGPVSQMSSPLDPFYGTHFGTAFFTIVGALYLDFGLIFTILLAFFFSRYIMIVSRGKPDVANLFLLLTYAMTLFNGVFVLGRGYGIQWIETFFIFFMLKFAQRLKFD